MTVDELLEKVAERISPSPSKPGGVKEWMPLMATPVTLLIFLATATFQNLQFQKTLALQQSQFYEKASQDEFTDILNRLSNRESASLRANAALRLAEVGVRTRFDLTPGTRYFDQDTNPFFVGAASQLATSVHLEDDHVVRSAVRKALRQMTDWARTHEANELNKTLVGFLADANRDAHLSFRSLARAYSAPGWTPRRRYNIVTVSPFCRGRMEGQAHTKAYFDAIRKEDLFDHSADEFRILNMTSNSTGAQFPSLNAIHSAASRLIDVRDSLSYSLKALRESDNKSLKVNLNSCFLVGAALNGVHLIGVEIQNTWLQGANLESAEIRSSNMDGSQLNGAFMLGTDLTASSLEGTDLRSAEIIMAKLVDAQLLDADLRHSRIVHTDLRNADLKQVSLQGATLLNLKLEGAKLYGAEGDSETSISATDWRKADFVAPTESDLVNEELKEIFSRAEREAVRK